MLWATFHALGEPPALAILAFAYFAGQVGNTIPIPGAVSGGMVGTLLAFGVAPDLALSAVLAYRAVAIWLPAPLGLVALGALRARIAPLGPRGRRGRRLVDVIVAGTGRAGADASACGHVVRVRRFGLTPNGPLVQPWDQVEQHLPATAESLAVVRALREFTDGLGVDVRGIELAVSEAVADAVVHDGGDVELSARSAPRMIEVVVRDHRRFAPPGAERLELIRRLARTSGSPTGQAARGDAALPPARARLTAVARDVVGQQRARRASAARRRARAPRDRAGRRREPAAASLGLVERQPLGEPDPEHRALHPALRGRRAARAPAAGERPCASERGVARGMQDVPPAHAADVRVGARAEPPPVVRAPVARGCGRSGRAGAAAQLQTSYQCEPGGGAGRRRPCGSGAPAPSSSGSASDPAAHARVQARARLDDERVGADVVDAGRRAPRPARRPSRRRTRPGVP